MTEAQAATTIITHIAIEHLHESPFNPRKTFTNIDSLANDIKAHGILSPLLVRPRVPPMFAGDADAAVGYEVVYGHRRLRAAELAELPTLPCMVRALTDAEARRAQISENLGRADVHPIEEAEGFQALIDNDGATAEQIAADYGKSLSYVYSRLKLLNLLPNVRAACLAGEVKAEVALLIARLRHVKFQEQALNTLRNHGVSIEDGGAQSYRRARSLLREKFSLDLKKDAIFDPADAQLLPDAGDCTGCPKRSGNAPEYEDLLQDEGGYGRKGTPNLCTDPLCFDAKKTAHLKAQAAVLQAKGKTVIDGNKARVAISATGEVKGGFVKLADVRDALKQANAKVDIVTIQDPRTGKTVEAVKLDDAKAKGVKVKDASGEAQRAGAARDWAAENRAREARAKVENERRQQLLERVHAAAAAAMRGADDMSLLLAYTLEMAGDSGDDLDRVARLWDLKNQAALEKAALAMNPQDQALLMLDIAMTYNLHAGGYEDEDPPKYLMAMASIHGVDTSTPSPAAQAQDEAAARGKPAKKAKAKKEPAKAGNNSPSTPAVAGGSDAQADLLEPAT